MPILIHMSAATGSATTEPLCCRCVDTEHCIFALHLNKATESRGYW
jgi:hypothetical protein